MDGNLLDNIRSEVSALYGITALIFSKSVEQVITDTLKKAGRLFSAGKIAVFKENDKETILISSIGFKKGEEIFKRILSESRDHLFFFEFNVDNEDWRFYFLHRDPLEDRARRLYNIFADTVEKAIVSAISHEAKERSKEKIRESEEKYRTIVENSLFGIYIIQDGLFKFVNKRLCDLFNYRYEDIVGKLGPVALVHQEDRALVTENIRMRIEGVKEQMEYSFRGLKNSGESFPVKVLGSRVIYNGKPAVMGTLIDLTREKEFERQLLDIQKMESLGVLAGGIAHDFNNLLVGIMGNVSMAQMKISPESPEYMYMERVEKAAECAAELTNQMLAYSGRGKFISRNLNLSTIVEEMIHLMQTVLDKKTILKFNLDRNLPAIEADPTQIHQVVMNLLTNASDSLGRETGYVTVNTGIMTCDMHYLLQVQLDESLPEGKYVYLEVSDTGCGMNKETISNIFDPFFTTKEKGKGLGLSAVIGIIRGHRGGIKISSEPGKGTTFKILFPPGGKKVIEKATDEELSHDGYIGKGTILVVDDEETVREVARSILEEFGFDVLLASDGVEALEVFEDNANGISMVLMDLSMPGMGGIETFRQLKHRWEDVKVIISSGYTEEDTVSVFSGNGPDDFIQKPYRANELISKVRRVLG